MKPTEIVDLYVDLWVDYDYNRCLRVAEKGIIAIHITPHKAFKRALKEGRITQATYEEARNYFLGQTWNGCKINKGFTIDFGAMYAVYAEEFANAAINMTPCKAFTIALGKGKINEKTYSEAHKYFGDLWGE